MSDIAIRVENLSKLYHIGALQQRHDTTSTMLTQSRRRLRPGSTGLRDALTEVLPRMLAPQRTLASDP